MGDRELMSRYSESDQIYMHRALQLADSVKGKTCPNPAVGAVVVKNNTIVGTGATEACGGLHAEKKALKKAGKQSDGGTLYVTMEPCCHFGRTPPCTESIVGAGISRVIIAVKDTNPLVNGKGVRFLRQNNISVSIGLMRDKAKRLNEDFFWSIKHHVPWITLKLALTLDGRIADVSGKSKWITGEKSRTFVHDLRRRYTAIAVGRGTFLMDRPKLTVRHVRGRSPKRIIFSSRRKIELSEDFKNNLTDTKEIIVSRSGTAGKIKIGRDGTQVWYTGKQETPDNLRTFLKMAYQEGIGSILVEGGQKLASSFLENKLVNRLYLFYGNKILGKGLDGLLFNRGLTLENSLSLTNVESHHFGDDVMITGIPQWED